MGWSFGAERLFDDDCHSVRRSPPTRGSAASGFASPATEVSAARGIASGVAVTEVSVGRGAGGTEIGHGVHAANGSDAAVCIPLPHGGPARSHRRLPFAAPLEEHLQKGPADPCGAAAEENPEADLDRVH